MTSGIYIMTNKSNGNRYVGYSQDIEDSYEESIRQLNAGTFDKRYQRLLADFTSAGKDAKDVFICGILEVTANDPSVMEKRSKYWKDLIQPEYHRHSS